MPANRLGVLVVAAPFRVRDTLGFKNIYPQAKACAYHFTGYPQRTSGRHFLFMQYKNLALQKYQR
ncbi:MAG: hypothetical protein ABIL39_09450 [candidate division WOR-3 bacterium]